jgi:cation:H+ antiporter
LFSADAIVKLSLSLASHANIPIFVIGLIILAVGTSLPELAFSLRSVTDHEPSMFFGNLLGSTIANSTLIIGIASFISPIEVIAINQYFKAVIAFVVVFIVFWLFIRSKHRLDRWEASMLVLLYIIFLVVELV